MTKDFEEIRITGLDVDRTQPSNKAPGLRHMYLKLSATPPTEWNQIFEQERSFPRHTMWRRAWVEGSYIVIDCVPEEIERYHLSDLREDVSNANQKYQQFLTIVVAAKQAAAAGKDAEKQRLDKLASRLKFDEE